MEGEWQSGKSVYWCFEDIRQELKIVSIIPRKQLKFHWKASGSNEETAVTIDFKNLGDEVGISLFETEWSLSVENVRTALDHACGWENVFCRLKAWVEAKIKLR